VESLSAYARQFLGQMDKPDVDHIEGLSPAVSIDQKSTTRNPRSTVGTVTEIYDYLRLLFARVGKPHCPECGKPISQQTTEQMVDAVLTMPEGTRLQVLGPVVRGRKGEYRQVLEEIRREGFVRVRVDGAIYEVTDDIPMDRYKQHTIEVVIDRLVVRPGVQTRLAESIETALKMGKGLLGLLYEYPATASTDFHHPLAALARDTEDTEKDGESHPEEGAETENSPVPLPVSSEAGVSSAGYPLAGGGGESSTPTSGENRPVTLLCAGLSRSEGGADPRAAEELAERFDLLLQVVTEAAARYAGRVERLLNDGVLVAFGVPMVREDDPDRALHAALAIGAGAAERGVEVAIGVQSGEAYLGPVGPAERREIALLGRVVEEATSLQREAGAGEVLVGSGAYRRTRRAFAFAASDPDTERGATASRHRLLRPLPRPEKPYGIDGLRAPLIGRETELAALQQMVARLTDGEGEIVCLIGDAGVGKSRLVAELRAAIGGNSGNLATEDTEITERKEPTSCSLRSLSVSSVSSVAKRPE
jgi:class 3 adenylate cyclase